MAQRRRNGGGGGGKSINARKRETAYNIAIALAALNA